MRRSLALLALVAALLAAGCGGGGGSRSSTTDAKAQYTQQLAAATASLERTFGDISDQPGTGVTNAQTAARLNRGADAIDQAADRFAAITPPAAAKTAHQKIVDGLHEIADQLRKAATAAKANDSRSLAAALQALLKGDGSQRLGQATAELRALGLGPSTTAPSATGTTTN